MNSFQVIESLMIGNNRRMTLRSDFDNGNIVLIRQLNELTYRLAAVNDSGCSNSRKTWFHFQVTAHKHLRLKFIIENIPVVQSMMQAHSWSKPVFREGTHGVWTPLKDCTLFYFNQIQMSIEYTFRSDAAVNFAMTIPFTYDDNQKYLKQLSTRIPTTISYSDNNRAVHMLTITNREQNQKKPIIFITCRVHPGEVSSSYCLMGMLQTLINSTSLQSYLLNKIFTFVIIPLVNPDGVYEGNYRMDINGVNLNRVYAQPSKVQHPTISAIKQKFIQFSKRSTIQYYFDLHSHSSGMKPAFIYGNAYDDIVIQAQSQLFCKILQSNCPNFKYDLSLFGQKHMKSKDKGENMSKEGCGRVVLSKMANIIHSYTVQTSIFPYPNCQIEDSDDEAVGLPPLNPQNLWFKHKDYCYQSIESMHSCPNEPNMVRDNKQLGGYILISILDTLMKNPYTRFNQQIIHEFRKQVAAKIVNYQYRFKQLDIKARQKARNIVQLSAKLEASSRKQWEWLCYESNFSQECWPPGFKLFAPKDDSPRLKVKTQKEDKKPQNFSCTTKISLLKPKIQRFSKVREINANLVVDSQSNDKKISRQTIDERNLMIGRKIKAANKKRQPIKEKEFSDQKLQLKVEQKWALNSIDSSTLKRKDRIKKNQEGRMNVSLRQQGLPLVRLGFKQQEKKECEYPQEKKDDSQQKKAIMGFIRDEINKLQSSKQLAQKNIQHTSHSLKQIQKGITRIYQKSSISYNKLDQIQKLDETAVNGQRIRTQPNSTLVKTPRTIEKDNHTLIHTKAIKSKNPSISRRYEPWKQSLSNLKSNRFNNSSVFRLPELKDGSKEKKNGQNKVKVQGRQLIY